MLAATILTLVFVPIFYAMIERLREGREADKPVPAPVPYRFEPEAKAAE